MHRNHGVTAIIVLAVSLLLTACGTNEAGPQAAAKPVSERSAAASLDVMLLLGGPARDGGFYQAMADGLKTAGNADGAIEVTVREKLAEGGDSSLENAVREAAASKQYDLIVAHGFDLVPGVAKWAPKYPKQAFATSLPVEGEPANVAIYITRFEDIGYNAGFLIAQGLDGKSGAVGLIGGPGLPFEKQSEAGFRQAIAEHAPAGTKVRVVYTGTFEDPQKGLEAAKGMVGSGVVSLWNQLAAGQSGVYEICRQKPALACFGNSRYSAELAPGEVLASTVSDYEILVPQWAQRLRDDAWAAKTDMLTLGNAGTTVSDATAAGTKRIASLGSAIEAFRADGAAGKVDVKAAPAG